MIGLKLRYYLKRISLTNIIYTNDLLVTEFNFSYVYLLAKGYRNDVFNLGIGDMYYKIYNNLYILFNKLN